MRFSLPFALFGLVLVSTLGSSAFADVLIKVDKTDQRLSVSVDGEERYSWPISTGVPSHDTPNGEYRAFRMERDHFSKEWDDAPMPYSIFFTAEGHAIHGTSHVGQLGRPASHGCVRLSAGHAAALFALVKAEGLGKTHVVVEGDVAVASGAERPATRIARHHRRPVDEDYEAMPAAADAGAYLGRGDDGFVSMRPTDPGLYAPRDDSVWGARDSE